MLKNVKSSFITKRIILNIDEKRKLKMLKYCKSIKNKVGIDLINYKLFQGKYIIYEEKGKGKEYDDNNRLIYEGEYLNGERNGKGKEYNKRGILIFEGEFKKGKRWDGYGYDPRYCYSYDYQLKNGKGYVKEYHDYDVYKKYEGEYLNGERNGKGKEYGFENQNLRVKFEGEYLNGKRWNGNFYDSSGNKVCEIKNGKSYIKEYLNDRLIFEGDYLNGERNGKGKEYKYDDSDYYSNNSCNVIFEGEYLCGNKLKGKEYINGKLKYEGKYLYGKKYNGKGYDIKDNVIYEIKNGKGTIKEYNNKEQLIFEGEYLNGQRNGIGKEYYKGKFIFKGEYLNGRRWNGKGKEGDNHGNLTFKGEWKDGKKWNGKIIKAGSSIIVEELVNGKLNGKGKEYYDNRLIYEGGYLNGKRNGKGKEYREYGEIIEAEYLNGQIIGKVKKFFHYQLIFEGEYNGIGKEYNFIGELIYEGEFSNGQRNGKGKEYEGGELIFEGEYKNGLRKGQKNEFKSNEFWKII